MGLVGGEWEPGSGLCCGIKPKSRAPALRLPQAGTR